MIAVSDAWKNAHKQKILPETFVEITTTIGSVDPLPAYSQKISAWNYIGGLPNVNKHEPRHPQYYATLEENLWILDGTRQIYSLGQEVTGFVSNDISDEEVFSITFKEPISTVSPGMMITWSTEYNEYPTAFRIDVHLGDTLVATTTITGNDSAVSTVELELTGYDKITLTYWDWNLPNHRLRLEDVSFGFSVTFDKNDILSYTHEQSGDLFSGALPKNSITFSVSNVDGKWNLHNPSGVGRYITERQKLVVRYGMDLDGTVEWIPGGTFFLSEWDATANGLEAKFVACDVLSFFLNMSPPFTGSAILINDALMDIGLKLEIERTIDGYQYYPPTNALSGKTYNTAEVIQYEANMNSLILYTDRDGNIHMQPLSNTICDYFIPLELAYVYPEITLSKQLKEISVKYRDEATNTEGSAHVSVTGAGEIQTVENPFISQYNVASYVAKYVAKILRSRKTVSGEFRADPRLDVFDVVEIESKYGTITPVAVTNIKYVYNGSFRGYYEGRVITI